MAHATQGQEWQIQAHVQANDEAIERAKHTKACYGLGANIDASELSEAEVITAYKGQSQVEGGFRCLKDPPFVSLALCQKTQPD